MALQHSLAAYEASEHSFPASLEALASAAREASREAEAGRYTIQYMPGKPRSDGRIISYTLTARAGNYAYLNLFADVTGQIHGTRENRLATAQDPVITKSPPINP